MLRYKIGWGIVVAAHIFLYVGNIMALLYIAIKEPWYWGVLMCTFFMSPAMAGVFCVFTNMENYFRTRLGWELIPDDSISCFLRWVRKKGVIINLW